MKHTTRRSGRKRSTRTLTLIVAMAGATLLVGPPASRAESAESRGQALLQAVDSGQRTCTDLTPADFEAIGEFTMGRMLGSPQAHESMDQLATRMMGAGGLERMHQVMGQRFAACGQPAFPGGFGQMMSMMPGMGGSIASNGGGSMMGGGGYGPGGQEPGGAVGPGSMMGSNYQSSAGGSDDDDDPGAWMAVAMLVLILGAGGLAYFLVRRRPRTAGAIDVLSGRFAAGEISAEDYAERRRLLQGGPR